MLIIEELGMKLDSSITKKGINLPLPSQIEQHQGRVESIDLESIYQMVEEWLLKRPLMADHDKQKEVFRLILTEIDEFLADLALKYTNKADSTGQGDYLKQRLVHARALAKNFPGQTIEEHQFKQWLQLFSEALDQVFFIMSHAVGNKIKFDYNVIYTRINGQGNQSNTFENLQLLASGILDLDPTVAMQGYLTVCASMISHLESFIDPRFVINKILKKNDGNHPEKVYQYKQVVFDEDQSRYVTIDLPPEEGNVAFANRIRSMRLIRRAVELAKPDNAERVQADLVTEHLDLILNHRDRSKIRTLAVNLVDSLGQHGKLFTYEKLVAIEAEPHRVISGLKPTEFQITPQSRGEIVITH